MIAMLLLPVILIGQTPAGPAQTTGTVTGRVLITGGTPAELQRVSAVAVRDAASAAARDREDVVGTALTDRAGMYRIEDLPPGRYHIVFGSVRLPLFYPGTSREADAAIVSVSSGAAIEDLDFVVQPPLEVRVSGRVLGYQSRTPEDTLILGADDGASGDTFPVHLAPNGSFEFSGVSTGVYRLRLYRRGTPGRESWQVVAGDRDITDVTIAPAADKETIGAVRLDDGGAVPPFRLGLSASAVRSSAPPLVPGTVALSETDEWPGIAVETAPDGSFRIAIPEGTYRVGISGIPSGFHLKSATYGAANLLTDRVTIAAGDSREIRVTLGRGLAPGTTTLTGRVVGPGSSVSLMSKEGEHAYAASVAADGTFEVFSILPGSYTAMILTGGGVSITTVNVGPAGVSGLVLTTE